MICLVQLMYGMIRENDRLIIIFPLEISIMTARDGQSVSGHKSRERYPLKDFGLLLPQRLRTRITIKEKMGYGFIGLKDPWQSHGGQQWCVRIACLGSQKWP